MKHFRITLLVAFATLATVGSSQTVKLVDEPGFVPYVTYYVSSIDLTTGATDVMLFGYRLREENGDYDSHEVWVKVGFAMTMRSPALGIVRQTTVLRVETEPFRMFADIRIDNRELSTETTTIHDLDFPPNEIPIRVHVLEHLGMSEFESISSSIMTSGKLANGEYRFEVTVRTGSSSNASDMVITDEVEEKLLVTTPTSLNLIAPGGGLQDTSENIVYTPYPIFQWETEPCSGCESRIRIAEFDPEAHSSPEDAIEGTTIHPLDQTEGWVLVGVTTSYQYPVSAKELETGKIYVWQIRKDLPTTEGIESYSSPIWAFKVAGLSQPSESALRSFHPILQRLLEVLGEDQYNAYFGANGSLSGYTPSGSYSVNGVDVPAEAVSELLNQFLDESVSIISISVE